MPCLASAGAFLNKLAIISPLSLLAGNRGKAGKLHQVELY
jgi:hypothetical protein